MEASPHPWPALGVLLLRDRLVTEDDLTSILDSQGDARPQRLTGGRLGEILVDRGIVTSLQVARLLAEQYELPFMELELADIDLRAAHMLTEDQTYRFSAIPIDQRVDGSYLLAIADPSTVVFSDEIRQILDSVPRFVVVGSAALGEARVYVHRQGADFAHSEYDSPSDGSIVELPIARAPESPEVDSIPSGGTVAQVWPPLGALLIREGLLTDDELDVALAQQRLSTSQRLGEILVERGVVTPAVIARLVAEQYELRYVELDERYVDASTVRLLSEELARTYSAVPIARHDDGSLEVAIADPTKVIYSDDLRAELGVPVTVLVASPDAIEALIATAYQGEVAPVEHPYDVTPPNLSDETQIDEEQDHSYGFEVRAADVVDHQLRAAPIASDGGDDANPAGAIEWAGDLDQELGVELAFDGARDTVVDATELDAIEPHDDTVVEGDVDEPSPDDLPFTLELVVSETVTAVSTPDPIEPASESVETHARVAAELDTAVRDALAAGASPLHISHLDDRVRVRARIEGVLEPVGSYPDDDFQRVIDALEADTTLLVSVMPTARGAKVAVAPFEHAAQPRSLGELGLPTDSEQALRESFARPGVVILSGPPRHGVTTTLFAALDELSASDVVVATLEDRVERLLENVDQIEVGTASGAEVAAALWDVSSTDTDVVLISTLLDAEIAEAALRTALAGRQVLARMCETDASSTVTRLQDLGVSGDLVAAGLTCIVSQRLIRRVCADCRETYYASHADLEELGLEPSGGQRLLARGRGCASCAGTGFQGHEAVFEVLSVNDELRGLIRAGADASAIQHAAAAAGMSTLRDEMVRLCLNGLTSTDELKRMFEVGSA